MSIKRYTVGTRDEDTLITSLDSNCLFPRNESQQSKVIQFNLYNAKSQRPNRALYIGRSRP